jgi:flavin-binding protein dodecin
VLGPICASEPLGVAAQEWHKATITLSVRASRMRSKKGIARAVKTLKNVDGALVKEQKVVVKNGTIAEYRVDLKVTFILVEK